MYKQMLIGEKNNTGKRGRKTEMTGRSQFRRRRFALDCSAIEEEKKKRRRRKGE